MSFKWGTTSLFNLKGIHPNLRRLADRALALSPNDFRIVDGLRTLEEQKANVKKGVSKTMRSRHLTGHAIDFAALYPSGDIDWHTIAKYRAIGAAFKRAAKELGITIEWGGDWQWKDWGHVQLDWKVYPA